MAAALLLLVFSLLSAPAVATSGGVAPVHSWKTLPVYLHSSDHPRLLGQLTARLG